MKRIFLIIFIILFAFIGKSQVYQVMPQYGYDVKRMKFDSTLQIPTFCGVPTLKSNILNKAAIAYDSCNKRFYFYDPKLSSWDTIKSGSALDTTSLSNRINGKADSSIALQKVLNNGNIAFNNIDLYDSTNGKFYELYLSPNDGDAPLIGMVDTSYRYIVLQTNGVYNLPTIYFTNKGKQQNLVQQDSIGGTIFLPTQSGGVDTLATSKDVRNATFDSTSLSNRINLKLSISDTSSMLSPYAKSINVVKYSDTSSMLSSYFNKVNYGLSKSGQTVSVDSATLSTKYFRIIDTTNKWVTSVTKLDDSTIRVIKNGTINDIVLTPSTTITSATRLQTQVYNNSGSTITKGSVVYINGRHSSNYPTIALAQANTEANSYSTFAMVLNDITNTSVGSVVQAGNIGNLNLPVATYTDGQLVYLSSSVAGGITTTKPIAPMHIVKIGTITRAHPTLGSIELKIENGWQLDELSDVKIAAVPSDSTLLQFSRVDSLWHDVSVTSAIGTKYLKPTDSVSLSNRINLKLNATDTASLSTRINAKQNTLTNPVTGTGTTGAIAKFTGTSTIGDATADVDYLQQDMSMVAYQAMGSSIKGYNLSVSNISSINISYASITSGLFFLYAIYIPKATTITGVKWFQTGQGVYTANNYNGVALYSVSGGTLTRVDSSANDGNIWKTSSNTWGSKAFSNTYSAAAGIYYVGMVYSSSAQTTAPSFGASSATINANVKTFDFTNNLKPAQFQSSVTILPTTISGISTTATSNNIALYLY